MDDAFDALGSWWMRAHENVLKVESGLGKGGASMWFWEVGRQSGLQQQLQPRG